MRAIHQFHAGSAYGDGVTNGLLFTRGLLRELGFSSEIYCALVAPELAGEIRPIGDYDNRADQVLLLHHSMGHDLDSWVEGLTCPTALVYHNITPAEFFPPDTHAHIYSRRGREQLARWRHRFRAAIGDSPFNAQELEAIGYAPVDVLPLLVDLDALRRRPLDAALARRLEEDDAFTILFVGRIVPNKRQHELILAVDALRRMLRRPVRLVLAGGIAWAQYQAELVELCARRGMTDSVQFLGRVSDATLAALYRGSDAFLCLSDHEGFGMPLIEAMAFDLPVVAFASGSVADTVAEGGLLLPDKRPQEVAATLKILAETPELRRRLVRAGRANLAPYARPRLLCRLADFLQSRMGVEVPNAPPKAVADLPARWRLEGPFDSSYSLALVNRHLAAALAAKGVATELFATEGPGDYQPDRKFLAAHPDIDRLWQQGKTGQPVDMVLRNLYPPRVTSMHGHTRLLASYGWEESGFPPQHVAQFNRHLNLITTVSTYVAKVLADNGVVVPIAVVGDGVDHIGQVAPIAPPRRSLGEGPFRFLHVSSCFPRKGLDALLAAWGQAFTAQDGVTLVIKTFPNPHNDAAQQIAELDRKHPGHAEIVLIDQDVDEARMAGFYLACDAVVMPSRGEGFGLPAGEAMWFERPVITTAYGGQTDFCKETTAWLVDYRFALAETHFGLPGSVWADPDVDDLARVLRAVHAASPAERQLRTRPARELIARHFTWDQVAARTLRAVAALDQRPAVTPFPTVAWICPEPDGPAGAYCRRMTAEFPPQALRLISEPVSTQAEGLDDLFAAIKASAAATAVLQFAAACFPPPVFGRLLERLRADGIDCLVVLPGAALTAEAAPSLGPIRDSLAKARRLIVDDVPGLNRLKDLGLVDNALLLAPAVTDADWPALSRRFWNMLNAPEVVGANPQMAQIYADQ